MGFWTRLVRFMVILVNDRGFEYEAGGKLISCGQCGNTRFDKSKAQLNTRDMAVWRLDYLDKTAKTLQCKRCGFILWFGKPPINRDLLKEKS